MSSNPLMMGYVALVIRHRLSGLSIHLRVQRPMCGRWAPCLRLRAWPPLPYL